MKAFTRDQKSLKTEMALFEATKQMGENLKMLFDALKNIGEHILSVTSDYLCPP